MFVYHFHPSTGDYLGFSPADMSPLEEGVFLIPAHATAVVPPEFNAASQTCRFADNSWTVAAIPEPEPPAPPTDAEIKAARIDAIQRYLDSAGLTRGYDSILSLVSYADDPDPHFAAEGQAGKVFRSRVWRKGAEILARVEAGMRPIPTEEEMIAELPAIEWPAV
jgi:hypothetical protein